jgi:gas vesicle structural protein
MAAATGNRYLSGPSPSGLADVVDLILDKGLVIDLYLRVSLIGIEILTVDARIVVASVDTYLRFAEAVGRLNLEETGDSQGLPELMESITSGGAKSKTKGALEGVKERFEDAFGGDEDEDEDEKSESESESKPTRRSSRRKEPARRRSRESSSE